MIKRFLIIVTILCAIPVANASVQAGFSPEGSARALVLASINHAKVSIDMMAYSFQAKDIVSALVHAEKRGVKVRAVIDKHRNAGAVSQKAIALAQANGIALHFDDHYHLQHDKLMIVDGNTLETGSFNFAQSAEVVNSENVLVIRDEPALISQFQAHFDSRWQIAK